MRKYVILFLWGVLLCGTLEAWANPISREKAATYAAQHFQIPITRGGENPVVLLYTSTGVPTRGSNDGKDFYVFGNTTGEGFVVVAGDDALPPILAYSDREFPSQAMPKEVASYLKGYSAWVKEVRNTKNTPSAQVLRDPTSAVTPLLRGLAWGQTYPYNLFTPEINGAHALTGCNATTCAQIMRYYAWPPQGKGSVEGEREFCNKPFDWAKMPNDIPNGTQEEKEAVSYLMREIGKAVKMQYSSGESSSKFPKLCDALRDHFDYAPSIRLVQANRYSHLAWQQMMVAELKAGRPVIYAGDHYDPAQSGHSFILDGYDGNGYFHVNWGWDGFYDGYFMLHKLTPTKKVDYSYYATAIIGACPAPLSGNVPEVREYTYDMLDLYEGEIGTLPITATVDDIAIKGVRTTSKASYPVRLGIGLVNEAGEEVRRCVSGKDPVALQPFLYKLEFDKLSVTGLPNGVYSLRPYVYEVENSTYAPLTSQDKKWIRITVADPKRTVALIDDNQPSRPRLEITWHSNTSLRTDNYNEVEWSVKNTGTGRYFSYLQAAYSDKENAAAPATIDDCTIREVIEIAPGEALTFRTPIRGPRRGSDKYLHFFSDAKNAFQMGKICTQHVASVNITPTAHYEVGAPDIQVLEKTEKVKGGGGVYSARFKLSAKGNTGAYLDNWEMFFRNEKGFMCNLEKLPIYVLEPGQSLEISLRKVVYFPTGDKYAFALAEHGDDGVVNTLCQYPFVVEDGESQLPLPNYDPTSSYPITLATTSNGLVRASEREAAAGKQVTLTLAPNQDYHLLNLKLYKSDEEGVTINPNKASATEYRFHMPAHALTVQAMFEKDVKQEEKPTPQPQPQPAPKTYLISLPTVENGSITASAKEATAGTKVTLQAHPAEGYELATLRVLNSKKEEELVKYDIVSDTEFHFTMPAHGVRVRALFDKLPQEAPTTYLITVPSTANGSVKASKEEAEAWMKITLTVKPNANYHLAELKLYKSDEEEVTIAASKVSETEYQFTMPTHSVTVQAVFEKDAPPAPTTYAITLASATNGSVKASKEEAEAWMKITLTVKPNAKYHLAELKLYKSDKEGVTVNYTKESDSEYSFSMPAYAVTVKAVFEKDAPPAPTTYAITLASATNGSVKASKEEADANTQVTLTVKPNADYHLVELKLYKSDKEGVTVNYTKESDSEYSFSMPAHAVTVKAMFEKDAKPVEAEKPNPQEPTYPLTLLPTSHGEVTIPDDEDLKAGTIIVLLLEPDTDYHLAKINVYKSDDKTTTITPHEESEKVYRFTMPAHAVTVQVLFEKDAPKPVEEEKPKPQKEKTYLLTLLPTKHGTITLSNVETELEVDTWVMLNLEPERGYEVDQVKVYKSDNKKVSIETTVLSDTEYSFNMPPHAVTVEATFKKDTNSYDEDDD